MSRSAFAAKSWQYKDQHKPVSTPVEGQLAALHNTVQIPVELVPLSKHHLRIPIITADKNETQQYQWLLLGLSSTSTNCNSAWMRTSELASLSTGSCRTLSEKFNMNMHTNRRLSQKVADEMDDSGTKINFAGN